MHFKWLIRSASVFPIFMLLAACGGGGGGSNDSQQPPVITSSESSVSTSSSSSSSTSSSTSTSSSSSSVAAVSTYKVVNISAPSLSGNIIGDPTERDIAIYLPKEYFSSEALLPVVYYLPGFGDPTMISMVLPNDFDSGLKGLTPMIIVIIPGIDRFGGSFFVDSNVTGNWSEFVVKDVVNYMDTHYRTIPKNTGRGLSGHSMGGFGAFNIAMRHPDVFSSVFALAPGLVGTKGIEDTQMFDSPAHIRAFITAMEPIRGLSDSAALSALDRNAQSFEIGFDIAYGMAFAPSKTPPYFEYPYKLVGNDLVRDDVILAKWDAGFGAVHKEVDEFKTNLSSLKAIGLDCGLNDEYQWIVRGCDYFNGELNAAGISLNYTTHAGMHQDKIRGRILGVMLPFFSNNFTK